MVLSTPPRVVDHESESFKNSTVHSNEAPKHDTLDRYSWMIKWFLMVNLIPLMWKEDISRAFRRLPVFIDHLRFAGCVFMANNVKLFCKHLGLPFGSIASVHGWERMGEFLVTMLRVVALCPALRYVDDFFGVSVEGVTFTGGLMLRVLTALVGTLCDPDKSREFMVEMLILGADIMVDAAARSFAAQLSAKKAKRWRK